MGDVARDHAQPGGSRPVCRPAAILKSRSGRFRRRTSRCRVRCLPAVASAATARRHARAPVRVARRAPPGARELEHDVAWPEGPTCACNVGGRHLGPCCRRHHRVKQQGSSKDRGAGSPVGWTGPTGRRWLSRSQRTAPSHPCATCGAPAFTRTARRPEPHGGAGQPERRARGRRRVRRRDVHTRVARTLRVVGDRRGLQRADPRRGAREPRRRARNTVRPR